MRGAESPDVRWLFYVGGMFGLLLAFVLRAQTATPAAVLGEMWSAIVRAVVWFTAYGLLERLDWSPRGRALALTAGVLALLVNLSVSGGVSAPSVAGPLWVAVALALNAVALSPVPWLSRPGPALILPVPVFVGVFLAYGLNLVYPVLGADGLAREAVASVAALREGAREHPVRNPAVYLQKNVLARLEEAHRLTPDDARLCVQLAWFTGVLWGERRRTTGSSDRALADQALYYGTRAARLDPQGGQGYWVRYQLFTRFFGPFSEEAAKEARARAPQFVADREKDARRQYELAAEVLEEYRPNDPHDVTLCFALASAWFRAGDREKARQYAEEALRLDEIATLPARKLTDPQREQLRKQLKDEAAR